MNGTNLIDKFKERYNKNIVPFYEDREDRNRWASSIIKDFPGRKLLNLGGGGERHLGKHLGPQWSVHEIDITGDCDTRLNLDQIDRLPFEDEFFDTSCAFEVLDNHAGSMAYTDSSLCAIRWRRKVSITSVPRCQNWRSS